MKKYILHPKTRFMKKKKAPAALGPAEKNIRRISTFQSIRIACAPTPCSVDGCIFKLFLAFDLTRCMVHMLSMGPLAAGHRFVGAYNNDGLRYRRPS